MVRLTAELISTSPAFVNTLKERELDLRGNKIAQIENLGATEDQYDVLDFSDNDITRLEGFPLLNRLGTIILNNNRVASVASSLGAKIPNLETLILTGNRLENLADLDPLAEFKKLHCLSLIRNPMTKLKHYRLYVIFKLPSIKVLDFQKVKVKERLEAATLFETESGAQLVSSISHTKAAPVATTAPVLSEELKTKIQEMISKTTSNEEIQRLDRALRSGKIPKNLERDLLGPPALITTTTTTTPTATITTTTTIPTTTTSTPTPTSSTSTPTTTISTPTTLTATPTTITTATPTTITTATPTTITTAIPTTITTATPTTITTTPTIATTTPTIATATPTTITTITPTITTIPTNLSSTTITTATVVVSTVSPGTIVGAVEPVISSDAMIVDAPEQHTTNINNTTTPDSQNKEENTKQPETSV